MNPETRLKNKVIKLLKTKYPDAWIIKTMDMLYSGLPDLLIVMDGRVTFVELKSENGTVKLIQEATISELRNAGAKVYVVYNMEQARMITL